MTATAQVSPTLGEFVELAKQGEYHSCFCGVYCGRRNASFGFQEIGPGRLQLPF